ncbi:unnamed protein product [Durusdinium trenchii]|uniref:ELMO domain-containing protein n=1 Tax=Durusdinium trenchii TaxID=1381693 RepID=A0ABP0MA81_9DINO
MDGDEVQFSLLQSAFKVSGSEAIGPQLLSEGWKALGMIPASVQNGIHELVPLFALVLFMLVVWIFLMIIQNLPAEWYNEQEGDLKPRGRRWGRQPDESPPVDGSPVCASLTFPRAEARFKICADNFRSGKKLNIQGDNSGRMLLVALFGSTKEGPPTLRVCFANCETDPRCSIQVAADAVGYDALVLGRKDSLYGTVERSSGHCIVRHNEVPALKVEVNRITLAAIVTSPHGRRLAKGGIEADNYWHLEAGPFWAQVRRLQSLVVSAALPAWTARPVAGLLEGVADAIEALARAPTAVTRPTHAWAGVRVGEASHPGPPAPATERRERALSELRRAGLVPHPAPPSRRPESPDFHTPRGGPDHCRPALWVTQGPPDPLPLQTAPRSWVYVPLLHDAAGASSDAAQAAWRAHAAFGPVWGQWVGALRAACPQPLTSLHAAVLVHSAAEGRPFVWPERPFRGLQGDSLCTLAFAVEALARADGYLAPAVQEALLCVYGGDRLASEIAEGARHLCAPPAPVPPTDRGAAPAPEADVLSEVAAAAAPRRRARRPRARAPRTSPPPPRPDSRADALWATRDLADEFQRRVYTLQAPPPFLRGALRAALHAGLAQIRDDPDSPAGWGLFLLAPRMLLFRRRGETRVARDALEERAALLARGAYADLLDQAAAAAALAPVASPAPRGDCLESAAHWASWADSLPVIGARHPLLLARVLPELAAELGAPGLPGTQAARLAAAALHTPGWAPPSWVALASGLDSGAGASFGDPTRGWQRAATAALDRQALEVHFSVLDPASRALLLSQGGAGGAAALTVLPSRPEYRLPAEQFRGSLATTLLELPEQGGGAPPAPAVLADLTQDARLLQCT